MLQPSSVHTQGLNIAFLPLSIPGGDDHVNLFTETGVLANEMLMLLEYVRYIQ